MKKNEYHFKISRPCIKSFNIRVTLLNWTDPEDPDDNLIRITQWPIQCLVRWLIKRAKKELIRRYKNQMKK